MKAQILALVIGLNAAADPPEPNNSACPPCRSSRIWWPALSSDTGHYVGYHVGGGSGNPCKAETRHSDEGTWGWDYQGWLIPRRVILGWWHGSRYQGGTGAYKTDGPRVYQP